MNDNHTNPSRPSPALFRTPVPPGRFFALAFVLSWLIWIPLALSHYGILFNIPESVSSVVRLLGVLMPAVSALVLTAASGEKGALRLLLGRLAAWRVGWRWWGAAGLVYPLLLAAVAGLNNLISPLKVAVTRQDPVSLAVNILFLLLAVLGEEIGWHGVALPAVQQRRSPISSSWILGLCWGIWHVPFWLLLDTTDQFGLIYLALNVAFVFPMTFFSTWFFNHSRYSLLLPVVFHLTFNIVNTALLPVTLNLGAFVMLVAAAWAVMLLVLPGLRAAPAD